MESFLTKTEQEGWNCSSTKNAKNGTKRDDRSFTQNEMERNKNGMI